MYNVSIAEALSRTQRLHDSREIPQGCKSPSSKCQAAQVVRLLSGNSREGLVKAPSTGNPTPRGKAGARGAGARAAGVGTWLGEKPGGGGGGGGGGDAMGLNSRGSPAPAAVVRTGTPSSLRRAPPPPPPSPGQRGKQLLSGGGVPVCGPLSAPNRSSVDRPLLNTGGPRNVPLPPMPVRPGMVGRCRLTVSTPVL